MSDVSAIGREDPLNPTSSIEEVTKEEKKEQVVERGSAGATREIMRGEEALKKATAPNIQNTLSSVDTKNKKFNLLKAKFLQNLENCKKEGYTSQNFLALGERLRQQNFNDFETFFESLSPHESELIESYLKLFKLAACSSDKGYGKYLSLVVLPISIFDEGTIDDHLFLELYKLEKEVQCPIFGKSLIISEIASLYFVFSKVIENINTQAKRFRFSVPLINSESKFYWNVLVPYIAKCYQLLDDEGTLGEYLKSKNALGFGFIFDDSFVKVFPFSEGKANPIERFAPLVKKYGKVEIIRKRFDEVFKDLPLAERMQKWSELVQH